MITAGGIAAGYYFSQTGEEEEAADKTVAGTTTNESQLSVNTTTDVGQLINTGEAGGLVNGATSSSNGTQLPQPSDFEQYEKYADTEGTLVTDIREGTGAVAAPGDTLLVAYEGWLTDGTRFDGSELDEDGRYQGFQFTLGAGQVIQGWEEGLVGIKVGGTRRLVVPAPYGYGEQGSGDAVPPNSMLIFDVYVGDITKAGEEPGL